MSLTSFRRHPEPVSEFSNVINSGELPEGLPAAHAPLPAFPTARLLLSTGSQAGSLVALESLDPDGSSTTRPGCRRCRTSAGPSNAPPLCLKSQEARLPLRLCGTRLCSLVRTKSNAPVFISQSLRPGCPRRTTALCWGGVCVKKAFGCAGHLNQAPPR